MPSNKKLLQAAAGNAGGDKLYVEDVFSTYVYAGTSGSSLAINNGLDLLGEGGLVWTKERTSGGGGNILFSTDADGNYSGLLNSANTGAAGTGYQPTYFPFSNTGYTTTNTVGDTKVNGNNYVSWSFRKAEKFFDIVTYTGDGTSGRLLTHNLGTAPGMVFIKSTSAAANWSVYAVGLGPTAYLLLNTTAAYALSGFSRTVSSTQYELGPNWPDENQNGREYVAYFFGNAVGGFGEDGNENIIKCGDYTGNGTVGRTVDFGFEPQLVLFKNITSADDWYLFDSAREFTTERSMRLRPNDNAAEDRGYYYTFPNATGMTFNASGGGDLNASGQTYVYMAIRRPMKPPTVGTEVFSTVSSQGSSPPQYVGGHVVDLGIRYNKAGSPYYPWVASRLTGAGYLISHSTAPEGANGTINKFDFMNGWGGGTSASSDIGSWMFKRATGFMDVVAYTGDGVAGATQAHNLGVVPEMMIVKRRSDYDLWAVYLASLGNTFYLQLNSDVPKGAWSGNWNSTTPTASVFSLGSGSYTNASGQEYIAYLFASVAGVSKVGSYTGTGSSLDVPCGFTTSARFILIRATATTGDWYVYDSGRGISALGTNDPYLFTNTTDAQVTNTDYVAPLSTGFNVTSNASSTINASGTNYIFLAIS